MINRNKQITINYRLTDNSLNHKIDYFQDKYGLNLVPANSVSAQANWPLLRVTKQNLILEHQRDNLFFHPSMALLRMINLKRGIKDRFLQATGLRSGDIFLDATMGLASDALIAAWSVGQEGKVIALEASVLLHFLVSEGLASFKELKPAKIKGTDKLAAWEELAEAADRIETVCTDHYAFLRKLPACSVDVIYFDPMFRDTLADTSPSIKPLQNLSVPEPLKVETVKEACRVARRRVVLKERNGSGEFKRLGFRLLDGGKYSSVSFGVIDTWPGGNS
ncbi:MAG: class I SAM-dependent methyltransferase [Peptococcaceae bacterium]|nr:class I SAM-dependent methyltransferase [Peptococcaceae bacterium]